MHSAARGAYPKFLEHEDLNQHKAPPASQWWASFQAVFQEPWLSLQLWIGELSVLVVSDLKPWMLL